MIYQHVMSANQIFGRAFPDKIKFVVDRIAVATDRFCSRRKNSVHCSSRNFDGKA